MSAKSDRDEKFIERMQIAASLAGNATRLAELTGISRRAIGDYLAGEAEPSRPRLIAIARAANVQVSWLATGEGDMAASGEEQTIVSADQVPTLLNDELLAACMKAIEKSLAEVGKFVGYDQRAKMISSLYNDILTAKPEEIMRDAELEQQRQRDKAGPTTGHPKRRNAS